MRRVPALGAGSPASSPCSSGPASRPGRRRTRRRPAVRAGVRGDLLLAFHGIAEGDQVSGSGSGGNRPEAPRLTRAPARTWRADTPDGALLVFLRYWILLYGAVPMEVFRNLKFALYDPAPMFDITLGTIAKPVGLEYPLRHSGPRYPTFTNAGPTESSRMTRLPVSRQSPPSRIRESTWPIHSIQQHPRHHSPCSWVHPRSR